MQIGRLESQLICHVGNISQDNAMSARRCHTHHSAYHSVGGGVGKRGR